MSKERRQQIALEKAIKEQEALAKKIADLEAQGVKLPEEEAPEQDAPKEKEGLFTRVGRKIDGAGAKIKGAATSTTGKIVIVSALAAGAGVGGKALVDRFKKDKPSEESNEKVEEPTEEDLEQKALEDLEFLQELGLAE